MWTSPDADEPSEAHEWPASAWPVDNDPGSGIRPIPRQYPSPPTFRGDAYRRESFDDEMARQDIVQEEWEQDYDMAHHGVAEYDALETDDVDESLVPRRLTAREIIGRIFGGMVFVGALYGCGTVLANPHASHEALDWVTLGHADRVVGAVERVRATIHDLVGRR